MKKFKIILDKKRNYHNHTNYNDHADRDMSVKNVIRKAEVYGLSSLMITSSLFLFIKCRWDGLDYYRFI